MRNCKEDLLLSIMAAYKTNPLSCHPRLICQPCLGNEQKTSFNLIISHSWTLHANITKSSFHLDMHLCAISCTCREGGLPSCIRYVNYYYTTVFIATIPTTFIIFQRKNQHKFFQSSLLNSIHPSTWILRYLTYFQRSRIE